MPSGGKRVGSGRPKGSPNKSGFGKVPGGPRRPRERTLPPRLAREERPEPEPQQAQQPQRPRPLKGEIIPMISLEVPAEREPLDFLLELMRHPGLPPGFRRDCAALALPYCHPKIADIGKKEQAELDAQDAERGSGWDGLLN